MIKNNKIISLIETITYFNSLKANGLEISVESNKKIKQIIKKAERELARVKIEELMVHHKSGKKITTCNDDMCIAYTIFRNCCNGKLSKQVLDQNSIYVLKMIAHIDLNWSLALINNENITYDNIEEFKGIVNAYGHLTPSISTSIIENYWRLFLNKLIAINPNFIEEYDNSKNNTTVKR